MQKTPTRPMDEPARKRRGVIETIGDMIDHEQRMAVYCDNRREYGLTCGFIKWADLEKLAARLGRDHSCLAPAITPYMWCPLCGGRKVTLRMHPPVPEGGQSHFHG